MGTPCNLAKQILAAAVLEIFPKAKLVGGEASECDFFYDFHFPSREIESLGTPELRNIEDRMRLIAHEKRPVKLLEMMRENAADYLDHCGQPHRAKAARAWLYNIVPLFEMGEFRDLCPPPIASDLKAFKLLDAEKVGEHFRILGTAFEGKEELKAYLKKYKLAKTSDHRVKGPKLGLLARSSQGWILLPRAEELRLGLIEQWRKMHGEQGFACVHCSSQTDQRGVHACVSKAIGAKKVTSIAGECDLASIFCKEELPEIISSLHFIDKVVKIFGFDARIYLLRSREKSLLHEGLREASLPFRVEEGHTDGKIEWRLLDCYGKEWRGPWVACEEGVVHRSLFGSLERWLCLLIESGSY